MWKRLFEIIEKADEGDRASRVFDSLILCLIVATVAAVVLDSFQEFSDAHAEAFRTFEVFSVVVFTTEYLLRLATADFLYPGKPKWKAVFTYMFSFMAIVDLVAILPFYIPMFLPVDLRFIRIIRLTRLFRLFKLNRYSTALSTISNVIRAKREELMSTVFIMSFVILISSALIYYIENPMQPEAFPNIIASFWWAVCTLTTVGYGDIYPVSVLGKILASIIAIAGIGIVALPTGIISAGFMEKLRERHVRTCPKCGTIIERE